MRSNSFHFNTFGCIFGLDFFCVSRLWQQFGLLDKLLSIFHRIWITFQYISFYPFFCHHPGFCIFGLQTGVNGHTGPWTVMPDWWSYFLIWNSLHIINYILYITIWMYLLSTLLRVCQWKTSKQQRLMCQTEWASVHTAAKKGQRLDPCNSHTLWLWIHWLRVPGLHISHSAFT